RHERVALTLEDLQECSGEVVDLLRVEALQQRLEPAEEQVEVEGRFGLFDRDAATGGQDVDAAGAFEQFEIPVADEVLVPHGGAGTGEQRVLRVHVELDLGGVVGADVDLLHGADLHPGDADLVAGTETGDVREGGPVVLGAGEPRLAEHDGQPGEDQCHRDGEDQELDGGRSHGHRPPARWSPNRYWKIVG